jgi:hypothetical protein
MDGEAFKKKQKMGIDSLSKAAGPLAQLADVIGSQIQILCLTTQTRISRF